MATSLARYHRLCFAVALSIYKETTLPQINSASLMAPFIQDIVFVVHKGKVTPFYSLYYLRLSFCDISLGRKASALFSSGSAAKKRPMADSITDIPSNKKCSIYCRTNQRYLSMSLLALDSLTAERDVFLGSQKMLRKCIV